MKAKFIYETLNFERGKDPKDAIGIGEITLKDRMIRKKFEGSEEGKEMFSPDWPIYNYIIDRENHVNLELRENGNLFIIILQTGSSYRNTKKWYREVINQMDKSLEKLGFPTIEELRSYFKSEEDRHQYSYRIYFFLDRKKD